MFLLTHIVKLLYCRYLLLLHACRAEKKVLFKSGHSVPFSSYDVPAVPTVVHLSLYVLMEYVRSYLII